MNMNIRVVIPVACLAITLLCGCSMTKSAQTPTETGQFFSVSLPPALAGKTIKRGGISNTDTLNQKQVYAIDVKNDDVLEVSGWAFDDSTRSVSEMVFIELVRVESDGRNYAKYYAAASRVERADVAAGFKEPAYMKAGYNLKAGIKSVPPGEYEINVIQVVDGNPLLAPTGKRMNKTN